tara:strand:+ start:434 stop:676 length:243 start_codon:yes stop_codon:yes gene_type:complete
MLVVLRERLVAPVEAVAVVKAAQRQVVVVETLRLQHLLRATRVELVELRIVRVAVAAALMTPEHHTLLMVMVVTERLQPS